MIRCSDVFVCLLLCRGETALLECGERSLSTMGYDMHAYNIHSTNRDVAHGRMRVSSKESERASEV